MQPDCLDAMVVLARTYERLDNIPKAREYYEMVVGTPNCQNVSGYFYYGVLLDKLKESDRAVQCLK